MKMSMKVAAALAVAAVTAVSMASPSQAARRHMQTERGALAAQAQDHAYDWRGNASADVRSGVSAYDYVPLDGSSSLNEHQCTMSPASPSYEPCLNSGD